MAWTNYPKLGAKIHGLSVYPRKKEKKINDEVSRYLPQNDDKP